MNFFSKNPYQALEKSLGYKFRNRQLLAMALTHRSFRFESVGIDSDNQRLEFLGDAALGLVASAYFFKNHPDLQEGALTTMRSSIASGKALAQVGRSINLGVFIQLGKGEENSGGRKRNSNITDTMEAILGAAFLDGEIKAVHKIFAKLFLPMLDKNQYDHWQDNAKGHLQAIAQAKWKTNPVYRMLSQEGPPHARIFTVEVSISGKAYGQGKGASKQEAQQSSAHQALLAIKHNLFSTSS